MKTLRVTARVYDLETREYVQRHVECPISDEVADGLCKAINGQPTSPLKAYGHGSNKDEDLGLDTPLADQKAFCIDPRLTIIDNATDEIVGGWSNM
jgi:hypothetical protein